MDRAPYRLRREQVLPRPLEEVFAFFADPHNLERITPGFLRFRILTPPPIAMQEGTLIDYRLAMFGVPFRWRTRIDVHAPRDRFVDRQVRGPYALWRHQHDFFAVPGGTLVVDTVDYRIPLGPLGRLAHGLFVERTLGRIFDHRRDALALLFGAPGPGEVEAAALEAAAIAPARPAPPRGAVVGGPS